MSQSQTEWENRSPLHASISTPKWTLREGDRSPETRSPREQGMKGHRSRDDFQGCGTYADMHKCAFGVHFFFFLCKEREREIGMPEKEVFFSSECTFFCGKPPLQNPSPSKRFHFSPPHIPGLYSAAMGGDEDGNWWCKRDPFRMSLWDYFTRQWTALTTIFIFMICFFSFFYHAFSIFLVLLTKSLKRTKHSVNGHIPYQNGHHH